MLRHLILVLLLSLSSLTAASNFSDAPAPGGLLAAEQDFLPIDQAYRMTVESAGAAAIRLHWEIAEGYYLYRHAFRFSAEHNREALSLESEIADGLQKTDEYFGDVEVYYHRTEVTLSGLPSDGSYRLSVTFQGCADAGLCYPPHTLSYSINPNSDPTATPISNTSVSQTSSTTTTEESSSLLLMVLFAMLGGVILNLMPCVFPVLSLKVLSFANDHDHKPAVHGLTYTAGVVVSFIAVAAILIMLQQAGSAVGWGFQLQSPWFVGTLAYLFFLIGLNLMGFYEIGLNWMNLGSKLAIKPGYAGSFFTGMLATVVASPCTAPFMGSALGYAVTQPPLTALTVFAALGFGMALPVLTLCLIPKLISAMPKPGAWMERFKQLLAFPMFATTIWLCWVIGNQTGANGMAATLIGMVLLALAVWIKGAGLLRRAAAIAVTVAAIGVLASPLLQSRSGITTAETEQGWTNYSPGKLQRLLQSGEPVFINVTADWCITCLVNERVTLGTDSALTAFEQRGVHLMKADWTNYSAEIGELLKQYGRTGIPLYLLYSGQPGEPATILPQILTQEGLISALGALPQRN